MIEQLTQAQIDRMAEYRDKWIAIGLSTEPANRPEAEAAMQKMYQQAKLDMPTIIWCKSPLANSLACHVIKKMPRHDASNMWNSVRNSVRESARNSVWNSVWDSARGSVGESARGSVWESVRGSVGRSVRDSVWESAQESVRNSVGNSGYGQHDAEWLAFYEYFHDVCGLKKQTEKLDGLWAQAKHAGWYLPHNGICFMAERHHILHRNERGQLHCPDGLAVGYPDGFGVYALNGVRMEEWMVMEPPEKMDAQKILGVANVEQRRELIRKIGIEQFVLKCGGKTLHSQGDYELLSVKLSADIRDARFLKMKNPSIGVYHIEGVHPACQTVQQAINWRASGNLQVEWHPTILT